MDITGHDQIKITPSINYMDLSWEGGGGDGEGRPVLGITNILL